jgi:chaperonin GroES
MAYATKAPRDGAKSPALAKTLAKLLAYEQAANIADTLGEEDEADGCPGLKTIGYEVERKYQIDKRSREDWEASAHKAMDIALQVRQPKNYPFQGAANIKYPLVTVAALQFGARAYPAIIDGNRIVKGQVLGKDTGIPIQQQPTMQPGMGGQAPGPAAGQAPMPQDQPGQPNPQPQQWQVPPGAKRAKADRVAQHMSYQLLNEMEEWEEDTDVLLHHLPIVGCCFRKVWRSEELGRNKSEMVPAVHLVVNNRVRSLNEPVPVTHEIYLYPQEIEERMRSGTFLELELPDAPAAPQRDGEPMPDADDKDAPHLFLEQHCYLDLDQDGYREPYIVTVHKDTCTTVRIVANYRMEDIKHDDKRILRIPKEQYFVKYSFIPDPKGGFYDIGFGKLLESLGETIDTTINQMLDAGHLQVAGGGLIGAGVRFKKDKVEVSPGKYTQVQVSGRLSDQIHTHQFPGPSAVLFNLLGMMVEAARDITAVKDILTGDTGDKGVQTATTTLALIEQGLKVFTAIYKRVYRSLKDEFKLLFALNARYLSDQEYFTFLDEQQVVAKSDYDLKSMDICPVADPKMVTDMQRSARANVLMQIGAHPTLGPAQNPIEALKRIYDSLGMEEPEKLIVQQQGPSPIQQLEMAEKASLIEKNKGAAARDQADAEKKHIEAKLAPAIVSHAAHMAENTTRIDAARLALDHTVELTAADQAHNELIQAGEHADRKFENDKLALKAKTSKSEAA